MLSRMEPTTAPMMLLCTFSLRTSWGMHLRQWRGPFVGAAPDVAGAARKIPSPPKIMFLMPGTVVIWKETLD